MVVDQHQCWSLVPLMIGTSRLEGGEEVYAGGLPFRGECYSLDHGMYLGQDIFVGNLPAPNPGRVLPIWDLSQDLEKIVGLQVSHNWSSCCSLGHTPNSLQ